MYESADLREVYRRLAKTTKPLHDERMQELPPLPERWRKEPDCKPQDFNSVAESI